MMSTNFLEVLRGRREALDAERAAELSALEQITDTAAAEERTAFNDDEQAGYDARTARIGEIDTELDQIDARMTELVAIQTAQRGAAPAFQAPARVESEARTYNPDAERAGVSFFRDVMSQSKDPNASARLARHQREAEVEARAASTSANFAGLVVPQYLTDMVAPLRRAGRPFADICEHHDLPAGGTTVNISRITTGTSTAVQASDGTAHSTTAIDDTLLTVNVNTIGGYVDLSRQAIDRGTGADSITITDLIRSYNTTLDSQLLNGAGSSGEALGVINTSSIVSIAYTDASPTVAEAFPKLFALISGIQSGVFLGVSHFVMHPRRWWWMANAVGTSFPFLQVNNNVTAPERAGAINGTGTYENGVAGIVAGIPVILDANIATNAGAGTNEDTIFGVTATECHLWEDSAAPMYIRAEEVVAHQGQVRFVVYGYIAFTAGRYPGAHGTIGGTGLVTPTFTGA